MKPVPLYDPHMMWIKWMSGRSHVLVLLGDSWLLSNQRGSTWGCATTPALDPWLGWVWSSPTWRAHSLRIYVIMTISAQQFSSLIRICPLPWQKVLEDFRVLKGIFCKVLLIAQDGFTKEGCIASHLMAKQIYHLVRKSGFLFTALYLKQCSTTLMVWRGGKGPVPRDLSVPVSLTRSGLPRIIPRFHRREILSRSDKGDQLIKLYLSWFSLSRILAKPVTKKTFSTMVEPPKDMESIQAFISDLKGSLVSIVRRYCPRINELPLYQGLEFMPTWKSLPTFRVTLSVLVNRLGIPWKEARRIRSCFVSFPFELASWQWLMQYVHAAGEQWSQGALWAPFVRYPWSVENKMISGWSLDWYWSLPT